MSSPECNSFISIPRPQDMGLATFLWNDFKEDNVYTDAHFNLETPDGDKMFLTHKIVMAIRSPYFADMFYGKQSNVDTTVNIVTLKNIDPGSFKSMLRHLYDMSIDLETPKQASELYKIALKFKVNSLMKLCQEYLSELDIVPSNVFDILEVAEKMGNKTLADRCMKLMQGNTQQVMQSYKLCEISTTMMHIFLDLPKLSLDSEYDLIQWVFEWARENCPENETIREFLEKLLPDMQFLSLSNVEYAKLCKDHANFFTQSEVVSIFMNIAIRGSRQMPDWYDKDVRIRTYSGSRD